MVSSTRGQIARCHRRLQFGERGLNDEFVQGRDALLGEGLQSDLEGSEVKRPQRWRCGSDLLLRRSQRRDDQNRQDDGPGSSDDHVPMFHNSHPGSSHTEEFR